MKLDSEITIDSLLDVEEKVKERDHREKGRKAPFVKDKDAEYFDKLIDFVLTKDSDEPDMTSEEWRKKMNRGRDGPIIRTFRTSMVASEPCKRFMVMQMVYPGKKQKISGRVAAIFDDGDWRHKRIQAWARKIEKAGAGKVHAVEGEVFHLALRQSGHMDVVVSFKVRPLNLLGKVLLELKGIKDSRFKELWCPKWEHFMQAQIYMHRHKLKWSFIVYENKDNQGRRTYKIAYDPKIGERIDSLLRTLNSYVDHLSLRPNDPRKGDLPPQEIESWCKTCPQRDQCFTLAERGI